MDTARYDEPTINSTTAHHITIHICRIKFSKRHRMVDEIIQRGSTRAERFADSTRCTGAIRSTIRMSRVYLSIDEITHMT